MDLVIGTRCLIGELVARKVQDLQTLFFQFFIHGFQRLIVRSKAAAGGGVDDQQDFSFIVGEGDLVAASVFYLKIVHCLHGRSS